MIVGGAQENTLLSVIGLDAMPEYDVTLLPKMLVQIVTEDNRVDDIVQVLIKAARTGRIGDGRIFIHAVEEVYHIRSGFMDIG